MRSVKYVIPPVLIAVLLLVQSYISGIFTRMPPRIELNARDYGISTADSIKESDLNKLKGYVFSYIKNTYGYAGGLRLNIAVTNGRYIDFTDISMIRGSFFTDAASDIGLNYAVISEDISLKLFNTSDTVGMAISLSGLDYTVTGVYRRNGIISALSSNGMDTVYIPSKSGFDALYAPEAGVQHIFLFPNK